LITLFSGKPVPGGRESRIFQEIEQSPILIRRAGLRKKRLPVTMKSRSVTGKNQNSLRIDSVNQDIAKLPRYEQTNGDFPVTNCLKRPPSFLVVQQNGSEIAHN
jgi:hypothetical protein